eukprot:2880303-Pyramimonas_sp.AAC.1
MSVCGTRGVRRVRWSSGLRRWRRACVCRCLGCSVRVYSRDGPIGRRKCGYILMSDQSDAGRAGIFS